MLELTVVQIAGILAKALGANYPLGLRCLRDHSAGYPIGFGFVPSISFVVAWRVVRQVAVTVSLNLLGFVSFAENLATSCAASGT